MAFGYNDTVWILSVIIWTTGYDCNNHVYQEKGGRISINPKKNLKREVTHIQIHHHYVGRPNKERIHKICFCDIGSVNCLFHRSLIDN